MKRVAKDASLHERTVQAAATGEKWTDAKRGRRKSRPLGVQWGISADPQALKVAKRLAAQSGGKVTVRKDGTILVTNRGVT